MIDWARVAKPQQDGYDSRIIAQFLFEKYGWIKKVPLTEFTICDGNVAVVKDHSIVTTEQERAYVKKSKVIDGMSRWNDNYATQLDPFLRSWNDGHQMLGLFLDEFWPKFAAFAGDGVRGSKSSTVMGGWSGHYEISNSLLDITNPNNLGPITAVYVSINSLQGCAAGIYHEVGHARLEALGMNIEDHNKLLILNPSDELYESPIRRDRTRPMSAVIQAIYSWIMLSENDLQCANIPGNSTVSANYLITNLPKIEDGLQEIIKHVRCTSAGDKFMQGYVDWGYDVVARARTLCIQEFGEMFTRHYDAASAYKVKYPVPL